MATLNSGDRRAGNSPPFCARRLIVLLLWASGLTINVEANAHDPGLSYGKIFAQAGKANVELSIARRDVELLWVIDRNRDASVSPQELEQAKPKLRELAPNWVSLQSNGIRYQGVVTGIAYDDSDVLIFSLEFVGDFHGISVYRGEVIPDLARGHRQFVEYYQESTFVSSAVLSASGYAMDLRLKSIDHWTQVLYFLHAGLWHIWIGYDHILFLLSMLLPAVLIFEKQAWRSRADFKSTLVQVVKTVSAFTLAHSVTLALAALDLVRVNQALVEVLIAASIIVAAANNLRPFLAERIWLMAFGFGLVHGFGFAGVLADLDLSGAGKGFALFGFNVGVELGQIAIVATILPLMFALRERRIYRKVVLGGGSVTIAIVASVWLVERLSQVDFSRIPAALV